MPTTHEHQDVREFDVGDKHVKRIVRDQERAGVAVHEETVVTDREQDHMHKEASNTITTTCDGVSRVKHVTSDKDVDGKHIHRERIERDGHRVKDVTVISKGKDRTTLIDEEKGNNVHFHAEVTDKNVVGVHIHEDYMTTDKDEIGGHTKKIIRNTGAGSTQVHEEQTITDRDEDNFHNEVYKKTKTTPSGQSQVTRVVTDKDMNGEHIHTEVVEKDGAHGHSIKDVTVIQKGTEITTVLDKDTGDVHVHQEINDHDIGNVHVHKDVLVTDEQKGDGHVTTIERSAEVGGATIHSKQTITDKPEGNFHEVVTDRTTSKRSGDSHIHRVTRDKDVFGQHVGHFHVHEEQVVTDKSADNYHKEVVKKVTTTPAGETYVTRVTTDKDVNGEHVHTETVERDGVQGHTVQEVTVVKDGQKCTTVVNKDDADDKTHTHSEVTDKVKDGVRVHEEVLETDKYEEDGAHIRQVVRNSDVGSVHTHSEHTFTDKPEGNYHKVVSDNTTATRFGESHTRHTATDRDVEGQHVGKFHVHKEQTITDTPLANHHKEVTKKVTTTPSGCQTYSQSVTTDKGTTGEHIHTETHDREGIHVHDEFVPSK